MNDEEKIPEAWAKLLLSVHEKQGRQLQLRKTPLGNYSLTRFLDDSPQTTVTLTRAEAFLVARALMEYQDGT